MTKDLEVRHCRALLAVKDEGGVGAAARALGVAQSTLSETLLSLERVTGRPVTTRRAGRGAALTAAAETLIPHARLVVAASEAAMRAVAAERPSVIRLGTVESISSYLLPAPINAFRSRWPLVDVRIAIGLCEDLRARVAQGELDAALTIEGGQNHAHSVRSQAHLRLVVRPGHRLARGLVGRRDLSEQAFLLADHNGAFNALLRTWLGDAQSTRLESAGSIDGVKRGIAESDMIGVLPDYAVTKEISARTLVALKLRDPLPPIALRLTTHEAPHAGSPLDGLIAQIGTVLAPLHAGPR